MSVSSGGQPVPVPLAVTADPGTEIAVIDHSFQVCGQGVGALVTEVVPGVYKLRYQAGFTVLEEYQVIEPGKDVVLVSGPQVPYSSAAPLPGTGNGERHRTAATELSRRVHATLGDGSQVFVFARAPRRTGGLSRITGGNPAAGLSLHDREGTHLLNLGRLARRVDGRDQWAGCTVAVRPGDYRLRLRPPVAVPHQHHLEQVIVASPGWQTQVFLTHSPNDPAGSGRPGGLAPGHTSVLQARIGSGLGAQSPGARLADLARIGLTNGRAIIPLPELLTMLSAEGADPMLGIYTAHAWLKAGGFDSGDLGEVVGALRHLLGRHPDVEALAHELGLAAEGYVFGSPPMLASSWPLILAASARQPGLVPPGSLSELVSTRLWSAGPWLLWLADGLGSTSPPRPLADVPGLVARASDTALLSFQSRRKAADDPELDDTEAALLTQVSRPWALGGAPARRAAPEPSGQQALEPAGQQALEPAGRQAQVERFHEPDAQGRSGAATDPTRISRDLGAALGLPPAAIPQIAASLVEKLEHAVSSRNRFRRLGWRLRGPLARGYLRLRRRRGPGSGQAWRGRRQLHVAPVAIGVASVLILVAAIWVLSVSFYGIPWGLRIAVSDVLAATLALVLSLTVGYTVFQWQRSRVRLHGNRARDRVYRTVGGVASGVAGRDELCQVIIDDLRNRDTRRPHVIVADAGAGKTALLAHLGQLLAGQGAVGVWVRLRDAQHRLDFRELAHQQFILDEHVEPLSEVDGETAWQQLSRSDRIVVLADGLEGVLAGEPVPARKPTTGERAANIRLALRQAGEQRLPLVVTSRPDSSLVGAKATVMRLEPLGEETALRWLRNGHASEVDRRLPWLVTTADVAESPLYLEVARQLQAAGLIAEVQADHGGGRSVERDADRMGLRVLLLDTWLGALLAGHVAPGVPLSRVDRAAVVDQLSVLACTALERGTREVTFDDFEAIRGRKSAPVFLTGADKSLDRAGRRFDVGEAALWGTELGLVAAQPGGLRFPDSTIHAYLASRLIETAMADKPYRNSALAVPGRDLLTALVMSSRRSTQRPTLGKNRPRRPAVHGGTSVLAGPLRERAATAVGAMALDLYAAALQIDCADRSPAHCEIAAETADRWADLTGNDQQNLDLAKLHLVRRLGEAARTVATTQRAGPGKPACWELYSIAAAEPTHLIRMEIAQQIAACGDAAFTALQDFLGPPTDLWSPDGTPRTLPSPPQELGQATLTRARQREDEDLYGRAWRETVVRAWLVPLLTGSAPRHTLAAQQNLARWLRFVSTGDHTMGPRHPPQPGAPPHGPSARLRPWLETALAQGFKYAANQRSPDPQAHLQARTFLLEQARELLSGTTFWFARLTLMQAMCLLSLDSGPAQRLAGSRGPNYAALVTYWAGLPADMEEHPFVAEARTLAVQALETGQPERFLWIDESTTAATVGSPPVGPHAPGWPQLWVPPSAGWAALHPRALKLLGDVLVLLNLAERGASPGDSSRRLQRMYGTKLPPCLDWDQSNRASLNPLGTIGRPAAPPGSMCVDGCRFSLCPYPPQGERNFTELTEAFCRRQQELVSGPGDHAADLRRFWTEMAQRAQRPL
ncbi:MAG TPA: hypothetical protein VGS19_17075 [Streptosporangiaceae bacterium]|nr:hypothetical protein [Streptosporangiaceae bacterium]